MNNEILNTIGEVINTLKTLNDYYYLKSNFIIYPKSNKSDIRNREPFRPGFLSGIEKRSELLKRLNKLNKNEKTILLLFYTFCKPITCIEHALRLSCRQCYRIKKKALQNIISVGEES